MRKQKKFQSRRDFLKMSSVATMGMATPFSALSRFKAINSFYDSTPSDYRALVVFFLLGGNDSYNMLMPKSGTAYSDYQITRSNLALDSADMLGIESNAYGLHPDLTAVHQMYLDNEAAFICNSGALVEMTTQQQYEDGTVPLPLGLFSHLDQYNHYQTAQPNNRTNIGWGGRIADLLNTINGNQQIPMNVSLSGSNIFQYGLNTSEFSMNSNGPIMPNYWDATWGNNPERNAAIDSLVHQTYTDMYMSTYTDIFKNAIEAGEEFSAAIDNSHDFGGLFSSDYVSQNFEMIAKTISACEELNFQRQIFYVTFGGWDHHDELLGNHSYNLSRVDDALSSFNQGLKDIGMFDKVTTCVMSEFSRKLTSNGNGTDHAWGGNMMVMGGEVNGGNMYGTYPSLSLNNNGALIHSATLIPDTATDSAFAELAMWYGVSVSDLLTMFPNLGNFHTVAQLSAANPPIGFMNLGI